MNRLIKTLFFYLYESSIVRYVVFVCFLGVFFNSRVPAQVPENGLVYHYLFNGNNIDQISHTDSTSVTGGIYYGLDRFGNENSSLVLDGNAHITIPTAGINITEGSVSMWVQPSAPGNINDRAIYFDTYPTTSYENQRIVIWKGGMTGADGKSLICGIDGWKDVGYSVTDWLADEWQHIAMTWRANNDGDDYVRLFVNGEKVAEKVQAYKDMHLLASTAVIGRHYRENTGFFSGNLDELRIYNRALTDMEIGSLFEPVNNVQQDSCSIIFCNSGNVGIGTNDTKGYKLAVAGKVIAEEIKVSLIENWPDFVFEKNYELNTIKSLEHFININGHLPGIPSKNDVIETGIYLGEMDSKLLMKIEELTLYIIEMNKKIESQNIRIMELEQKNEKNLFGLKKKK